MKLPIKNHPAKNLVIISMLTAVSAALNIIESSLPIIPAVPGGKLGLANVIAVIVLYAFNAKHAFALNVMKSLVASFLFSGISSLPYSLSGAVFSTLIMIFLKKVLKEKVTPVGLCVAGAASHNFAQVLVASIILSDAHIFTYFVPLSVISIISGFVTGTASMYFLERKIWFKKEII